MLQTVVLLFQCETLLVYCAVDNSQQFRGELVRSVDGMCCVLTLLFGEAADAN